MQIESYYISIQYLTHDYIYVIYILLEICKGRTDM